ncbi:MAG: hypothetical protein ACO3MG_07550 [Saprospiraceae bacterium]
MEDKNTYRSIRDASDRYSIEPDERLWDRVEAKLRTHEHKKRLRVRKIWRSISGIAAAVLLAVVVTSIFHLDNYKAESLAKGQIEALEDLPASSDYFYSVNNARKLRKTFSYQEDLDG